MRIGNIMNHVHKIIMAEFRMRDRTQFSAINDHIDAKINHKPSDDLIYDIREMCAEELEDRVNFTWNTFKRVLDELRIDKTTISSGEVISEIEQYFPHEVPELFKFMVQSALRISPSKIPDLEGARDLVLNRVKADIELFFHSPTTQSRAQKTLPLTPSTIDSTPNFSSLTSDNEFKIILTERWVESQECVAGELHVAAIIMMGSLLEGVLYAKIKSDLASAKQSSSAPKDSRGKVKKLSQWTLREMIDVAHECQWIHKDGMDFVGSLHILRDYRNIVHPRKHLESGIVPDVDTCAMAWPVVRAAINDLIRSCSVT